MSAVLQQYLERRPIVGLAASLSASAISLLEQLDLLIRVLGGAVALAIGVVTLIVQLRKLRKAELATEEAE